MREQISLWAFQSVRWHSGEQYIASLQAPHVSDPRTLQTMHLAEAEGLDVILSLSRVIDVYGCRCQDGQKKHVFERK